MFLNIKHLYLRMYFDLKPLLTLNEPQEQFLGATPCIFREKNMGYEKWIISM